MNHLIAGGTGYVPRWNIPCIARSHPGVLPFHPCSAEEDNVVGVASLTLQICSDEEAWRDVSARDLQSLSH